MTLYLITINFITPYCAWRRLKLEMRNSIGYLMNNKNFSSAIGYFQNQNKSVICQKDCVRARFSAQASHALKDRPRRYLPPIGQSPVVWHTLSFGRSRILDVLTQLSTFVRCTQSRISIRKFFAIKFRPRSIQAPSKGISHTNNLFHTLGSVNQ